MTRWIILGGLIGGATGGAGEFIGGFPTAIYGTICAGVCILFGAYLGRASYRGDFR